MTRPSISAGLCETCAHMREIRSAKGSRFLLCELAAADPRFGRYPRIPVLECRGYSEESPGDSSSRVQGPGVRDQK